MKKKLGRPILKKASKWLIFFHVAATVLFLLACNLKPNKLLDDQSQQQFKLWASLASFLTSRNKKNIQPMCLWLLKVRRLFNFCCYKLNFWSLMSWASNVWALRLHVPFRLITSLGQSYQNYLASLEFWFKPMTSKWQVKYTHALSLLEPY